MSEKLQIKYPLNTFVLDIAAGEYYDFKLPENSDYPLRGVTYPVDYGHIPKYTAEDHHELDLYFGRDYEGEYGYFEVWRSNEVPKERKFFAAINNSELDKILAELKPVLVGFQKLDIKNFYKHIEEYKDD